MRKLFRAGALALGLAAASAAPAGAAVPHTVQPGETLWTIAAANGFTTRSFAAYNGLGPDSNVVVGRTIMVPDVPEAAAALSSSRSAGTAGTSSGSSSGGSGTSSNSSSSTVPIGAYTVQPGDTLSSLAARAGVPLEQMAWMNGLAPNAQIVAGTSLKLPSGAPIHSPGSVPAHPVPVAPQAPPHPTPVRLSPSEVGSIGAQQGVSPALAAAVASEESGFNNDVVSPTSARGIMQIMPGTWDYVKRNLSSVPLDPFSAADNVRAGTLYLSQLLRATGGNTAKAVAGYYQGLGSVRQRGLYDDTKRYVENVLALRGRFGG